MPAALSPIRVAPGGRCFETLDGEPFLFIGPNDAISWPGLAGLYRRRDVASADVYLRGLAESGVTVLRLMLEYAHKDSHYFEKPYGRFSPVMVRLWDDLFALCARHGLRVLLMPWDNFWMARRWHKHPYNTANGGPAHSPAAFFLDDTVLDAGIRRLLFVVERWGGSGALAAWDLFNEIDPYWGGTPEQQAEAITRVSRAIRQAEEKRWGFSRPQTVSIFGPKPSAAYEELIFRHPCLDFATTHIYEGAIDYPLDTVTPALAMGRWVRHALARCPANRPFLDTEHGPIHLFNDHKKMRPEAFDDEYERHLMWAHLASGGAGSGMRWPARHPHVLTAGMQSALAGLAGFVKQGTWRCFAPHIAAPDVAVSAANVHCFACQDAHQAVIWLLRGHEKTPAAGMLPTRAPLRNVTVTLRGLSPGSVRILLWHTREGRALNRSEGTVSQEGTLRVVVPELENDLALAVQRGA